MWLAGSSSASLSDKAPSLWKQDALKLVHYHVCFVLPVDELRDITKLGEVRDFALNQLFDASV
jgi:hypothetical protein